MTTNCCEHCSEAKNDHDILIRIDQHLIDLSNKSDAIYTSQQTKNRDFDTRLRGTEQSMNRAIGALAIVQVAMGVFFTILTLYLSAKGKN